MSVLTRIARPYTTFKEHGGDDEDLIQHCEACFKSGPGTVDRMKYDGAPNKWNWQGPFRIWFLKAGTMEYYFYDTEDEARAWRTLRGLDR